MKFLRWCNKHSEENYKEIIMRLAITEDFEGLMHELGISDPIEAVNLSLAALDWVVDKKLEQKHIVAQSDSPTEGEEELVVPNMAIPAV